MSTCPNCHEVVPIICPGPPRCVVRRDTRRTPSYRIVPLGPPTDPWAGTPAALLEPFPIGDDDPITLECEICGDDYDPQEGCQDNGHQFCASDLDHCRDCRADMKDDIGL